VKIKFESYKYCCARGAIYLEARAAQLSAHDLTRAPALSGIRTRFFEHNDFNMNTEHTNNRSTQRLLTQLSLVNENASGQLDDYSPTQLTIVVYQHSSCQWDPDNGRAVTTRARA